MRTNRGKGYFHSSGAQAGYRAGRAPVAIERWISKKTWPQWAKIAYLEGFHTAKDAKIKHMNSKGSAFKVSLERHRK